MTMTGNLHVQMVHAVLDGTPRLRSQRLSTAFRGQMSAPLLLVFVFILAQSASAGGAQQQQARNSNLTGFCTS